MPRFVFVYGTLQLDLVQRRVTGRAFPARRAVLEGYARGRVRGERYPSLRPEPGARVRGLALEGVDGEALARLDAYEGERYERIAVEVALEDGARAAAWAWLLAPGWQDRVGEEPWDLARFEREDLAGFLEEYEGFDALQERGEA